MATLREAFKTARRSFGARISFRLPNVVHLVVLNSTIACLCCTPARSASQRELVYFRFKLELVYDRKPFVIDFVAGCSVKITSYSFGGTSQDFTGMTALTYAVATPDGHAIAVQTVPNPAEFNPCRGDTTANGRVPRDWLPLVLWFERADELAHGIAYATQDAYENPNARFGFTGVTVESATREAYEDFTRRGSKNLLPAYHTDWLSHSLPPLVSDGRIPQRFIEHPQTAWTHMTRRDCTGVSRVKLTEAQRARLREFWPSNRPRFWMPADRKDWDTLRRSIPDGKQPRWGIPRYQHDAADRPSGGRATTYEIYPGSLSYALNRIDKNTALDGRYYLDIEIQDGRQNRGFLYCDSLASFELERAITGRRPAQNSRSKDMYCRVDGQVFTPDLHDCFGAARWTFYENDEFAVTMTPPIGF